MAGFAIVSGTERFQFQAQPYIPATSHAVGLVVYVFLVETVVALIGQLLGDALALAVEQRHAEVLARLQSLVLRQVEPQQAVNACVGYFIAD